MDTTVGVDLVKNCFQVVEADAQYRLIGRKRLTRWMGSHPACQVVMEACGTRITGPGYSKAMVTT